MTDVVVLVLSFGFILLAAEFFTNAVEWLGKILRLGEGAIGSVIAAVGTAMPETMISLLAILAGHGEEAARDVGIGAILGAPFMLATLALCLVGIAAVSFPAGGRPRRTMLIDSEVMKRDLRFFLVVYTVAIGAAFIRPQPVRIVLALGLWAAYAIYVAQTFRNGGRPADEPEHLRALYLWRRPGGPPTAAVVTQVVLALAGIVVGARYFVLATQGLAEALAMPAFVLSLLVAPVATELPEKLNSLIWVSRGQDTLALGNITGAMVFQGSVIPAIGILLTPWVLNGFALLSAALAIGSALLVYLGLRRSGTLAPTLLLTGGVWYSVFLSTILATGSGNARWYLLMVPVGLALYAVGARHTARHRAVSGGE